MAILVPVCELDVVEAIAARGANSRQTVILALVDRGVGEREGAQRLEIFFIRLREAEAVA